MATGTIVSAWKDSEFAYAAVRIGKVEFIGQVPLKNAEGVPYTAVELRELLTAEVRVRYLAQTAKSTAVAISGTVEV